MSQPEHLLRTWVGQRAQELRREQTRQEQQLWQALRAKRFAGFKFRRQEPIGRYIADFVCFKARLIVELDGSQHIDQMEHDTVRDDWLQSQGFVVLRFWNHEWDSQPEAVAERIWMELMARKESPSPQPLSHEGRGASIKTPLAPCGRGAGGEGKTHD